MKTKTNVVAPPSDPVSSFFQRIFAPTSQPSSKQAPPIGRSPTTRGVQAISSAPSASGGYYLQADARWANDNIGLPLTSNLGTSGCGITSIANAIGIPPDQVLARIQKAGGFASKELSSFDTPRGLAAVGAYETKNWNNPMLSGAVKANKPVVIDVSAVDWRGKSLMHFIALLPDKWNNGKSFRAVDPASGPFTMTQGSDGLLRGTSAFASMVQSGKDFHKAIWFR